SPFFLLEYPYLTLLSSPHLLHIIFILIKHLLYHKLMWAIPEIAPLDYIDDSVNERYKTHEEYVFPEKSTHVLFDKKFS
ncbi:MAG: hypothetical protein RLZZ210_702, partial [Pseudomonadota bacterium]